MKLLRSITRRGFEVGTAGWFTVLKPNTWFPASRLPGGFAIAVVRLLRRLRWSTQFHFASSLPATKDRRLVRSALVVLAAVAITSALLWWIMHP